MSDDKEIDEKVKEYVDKYYNFEKLNDEFNQMLNIVNNTYNSIEKFLKTKVSCYQSDLNYVKTRLEEIKIVIKKLHEYDIMIKHLASDKLELDVRGIMKLNKEAKLDCDLPVREEELNLDINNEKDQNNELTFVKSQIEEMLDLKYQDYTNGIVEQ